MSGSTISTSIASEVKVGSGRYASPLTIAPTGSIAPVAGSVGLYLGTPAYAAVNYGQIAGGPSSTEGGYGVYLNGILTNFGTITGGANPRGLSGAGVSEAGGTLINHGNILGGSGNLANLGVFIGGGTLLNFATIQGGEGALQGATGVLAGAAYVVNAGLIAGGANGGYGAGIASGGTIANSGTITGALGLYINGGGELGNSGLVTGGVAARYREDGLGNAPNLVVNTGTLLAGSQSEAIYLNAGTLSNAGLISGPTAVLFGAESSNSRLIVETGAEFIGHVTDKAHGSVLELSTGSLASGSISGIGSSFIGFATVAFDPGATWMAAGSANGLAGGQAITGFGQGDTIELTGFNCSSDTFVAGTGLLLANATSVETLDITGAFSTGSFGVSGNEAGTQVMLCYLAGTELLTPSGACKVEDLRIGDLLVTRLGGFRPIKWIGRQCFDPRFIAGNPELVPVRIAAGALGPNRPARALTVSPGHSLLLGEILVLAKQLVNGISITQTKPVAEVRYHLVEFETHDCVLAEGAWAESFADAPGLRARFHNAAEFHALYPDDETPPAPRLCAERPAAGPALEAAIAAICARAPAAPGALRGYVDFYKPGRIEGWAQDAANPELPVALEIFIGGARAAGALACHYREDLAKAGIGRGYAHFAADLPLLDGVVEVRRMGDAALLPHTETCRRAA